MSCPRPDLPTVSLIMKDGTTTNQPMVRGAKERKDGRGRKREKSTKTGKYYAQVFLLLILAEDKSIFYDTGNTGFLHGAPPRKAIRN